MYLMSPYDDALQNILDNGVSRTNKRTGIKTLSIFGMLNRYRLDKGYFPLVTRRKMFPKSVWAELIWFLSGSTNNEDLKELGCNFWTPWVSKEFTDKHKYPENEFGPVYGFQLRHFGGDYEPFPGDDDYHGEGGFDQLSWVVNRIKEDPSCRRTLWTLWNPKDLDKMRLPPCHMLCQVLVDDDRKLSMILYQRSCDFPVGVPANIQFYSALTIMLAQQTGCEPYEFIHMTADSHIYEDQIDAVKEYLTLPKIDSPKLTIKRAEDIFSYLPSDFELRDFECGPKLNIPVAV